MGRRSRFSRASRAEAERRARRQVEEVLDDIREGRLAGGHLQSDVGALLGVSRQWVSLMERGVIEDPGLLALTRLAAAVGLNLSMKTFPATSVLRDAGQAKIINRFCPQISDTLPVRLEVQVARGDPRAFDLALGRPPDWAAAEVISRLRDVQAQVRAALAKQEAAGAPVLILVIGASHANRRAVREAGMALRAAFPLESRAVLASLRRGTIPPANGIVLI